MALAPRDGAIHPSLDHRCALVIVCLQLPYVAPSYDPTNATLQPAVGSMCNSDMHVGGNQGVMSGVGIGL